MIGCKVLGPIEVTVAGEAAPPELLWRKNLALLIYLARSPKRARSRDHLVGLLWGDKQESAARHSLNEALRVLRKSVGDAELTSEGDRVRLGEALSSSTPNASKGWSLPNGGAGSEHHRRTRGLSA